MEEVEFLARLAAIEDALGRVAVESEGGGSAMVVKTVSSPGYPTAGMRGYPVVRVDVSGPEAEGATPVLTPVGAPFVAFNLGTGVPGPNSYFPALQRDGRWVFRHD